MCSLFIMGNDQPMTDNERSVVAEKRDLSVPRKSATTLAALFSINQGNASVRVQCSTVSRRASATKAQGKAAITPAKQT